MTTISHESIFLPRLLIFFFFLKFECKFLCVGQKLFGPKKINIKNHVDL